MLPIVQKPVIHFWKGHGTFTKPDCIVIHIAEGLRDSVYQEFVKNEKSTHYLVNKDGTIWQFVDEKDSAWGNGILSNPKSSLVLSRPGINPNVYTISVEHEGFAKDGDISETMYNASIELVASIAHRWNIPIDNVHVIRHRDIYDKKTCPGVINVEKIITRASLSVLEPAPLPPVPPSDVKVLIQEIKERIAHLEQIIN